MRILAVIPARGGSKGIPKKNIVKLNDKPLIQYTIEEGIKVKDITDLVVSTDNKEIQTLSIKLGAQAPFLRPKYLSTDRAQSAPVIEHALKFMEKKNKLKYDLVLMLQPTTPFRKTAHIKQAIKLFKNNICDSIVSVVSVDSYHPLRMKKIVNNRLINYIDQDNWNMKPRQDLPPVYIRNGCIYLIERSVFLKRKSLIGKNCFPYIMASNLSINIDNYIDLMLARSILNEKL